MAIILIVKTIWDVVRVIKNAIDDSESSSKNLKGLKTKICFLERHVLERSREIDEAATESTGKEKTEKESKTKNEAQDEANSTASIEKTLDLLYKELKTVLDEISNNVKKYVEKLKNIFTRFTEARRILKQLEKDTKDLEYINTAFTAAISKILCKGQFSLKEEAKVLQGQLESVLVEIRDRQDKQKEFEGNLESSLKVVVGLLGFTSLTSVIILAIALYIISQQGNMEDPTIERSRAPYIASIELFISRRHVCSGVLVAPLLLLTSAHCVDPAFSSSHANSSVISIGNKGVAYGRKDFEVSTARGFAIIESTLCCSCHSALSSLDSCCSE